MLCYNKPYVDMPNVFQTTIFNSTHGNLCMHMYRMLCLFVYMALSMHTHMYAIEGKYEGYNVRHTYVWGARCTWAVETTFPRGSTGGNG